MILNFLKTALVTDVNNLFEDVSVLENLNNYNKNYESERSLIIKPKEQSESKFSLNTEKPAHINTVLNTLVNPAEKFTLASSKVKFVGRKVFIDLVSPKLPNLKQKKISFIIESQETSSGWKSESPGTLLDIGELIGIKFVKSYQSQYLYVFFTNSYLKLDPLSIKVYI